MDNNHEPEICMHPVPAVRMGKSFRQPLPLLPASNCRCFSLFKIHILLLLLITISIINISSRRHSSMQRFVHCEGRKQFFPSHEFLELRTSQSFRIWNISENRLQRDNFVNFFINFLIYLLQNMNENVFEYFYSFVCLFTRQRIASYRSISDVPLKSFKRLFL